MAIRVTECANQLPALPDALMVVHRLLSLHADSCTSFATTAMVKILHATFGRRAPALGSAARMAKVELRARSENLRIHR